MAPSIPVVVHFAVAAFFGNVAFCAMGFGMGICFLFLYQIGAIAGLVECCGLPGLKNAVFLQTIALVVIQPIILCNVGLRKNIRWEIMLLMIPPQLVAVPLGQYLQDFTPAPVLKTIVGVLTIGVAGMQIFTIYRSTRSRGPANPVDLNEDIKKEPVLVIVNPTKDAALSSPTEYSNNNAGEIAEVAPKREPMVDCSTELREIGLELKKELWPPRIITMWMFVSGFTSGFFAGLISVGGPPLIVFFFFYDYPKAQVKANGTVITAANTLVRIITYMVKPTPAEYGHDTWFVGEEVWLYVVVAVVGLLASPIGIYLSRYLNNWTYKAGLAVLLIINGITMIATSIVKLSE